MTAKGAALPQKRKWLPGVDEDANYEFSISLLPATPEPPKMRKRDRDRAERLRLAGGPKPSLRDRAVALAIERGTVRTRDLTDIGVPRCYLARMCEEGLLTKVGYGLYSPGRLAA
ncbi:type IV toxin-antitoxin system AbiEi family antitoxin domain-containing protein [Sphingomonas fennica]